MAALNELQAILGLMQQGFTPEQARAQVDEAKAMEFAKLKPEQMLGYNLAKSGQQLSRGLSSLFGVAQEDPTVKMATQMRQLQQDYDTTTASGMAAYGQALRAVNPALAEKAALAARDMGIKEAQLFREQATGAKAEAETRRVTAQAEREEAANVREDQLRGELAALSPDASNAAVEAVVRKYGKPDQIFASLERRQKAEADRQAKAELEREKAEDRKRRDEEARDFKREMAAASAAMRSAVTSTQREIAEARLAELKDKQQERTDKKEAAKAAALNHAQKVIGDVRETTQLVGGLTTGLTGKASSFVPGTDAYNLNQRLLTLKANLGFDRLQQMREASPTGGALGQVAVQELNALQATVGSLDIGQDRKELAKNLEKVEHHYNNWLRTTQGLPALSLEEFKKTKAPATPAATPAAPAAPAGGGSWSIRLKQ